MRLFRLSNRSCNPELGEVPPPNWVNKGSVVAFEAYFLDHVSWRRSLLVVDFPDGVELICRIIERIRQLEYLSTVLGQNKAKVRRERNVRDGNMTLAVCLSPVSSHRIVTTWILWGQCTFYCIASNYSSCPIAGEKLHFYKMHGKSTRKRSAKALGASICVRMIFAKL